MLLEEALIGRVLHEGSAQKAISQGVHEGWFSDPILSQAWAEIVNHSSRSATRNETPSIKRLVKKVPGLRVLSTCPEETLSEIILDLSESKARATLQGGLLEVDDLLRNHGVDMAVDLLNCLARDLSSRSLVRSHMRCDLADAIPAFQEAYEKIEQGGGIIGMPFPWDPLNVATGGLQPGTLNVIYAPSKNGKTWIGLEVGCVHPFEAANARVLVVSNEMPVSQVWRRILARMCRLEYGQVTGGSLPLDARDECFDHLNALQETQIANMRKGLTKGYRDIRVVFGGSDATCTSIRNEIDRFEPDIVFIDGLYLMADDRQGGRRDNGWKTIANITQDLKALAAECNVPVVGTTQSNREGVKRKAGAEMDSYADIGFGLGAIQDADLVMRLQKIKDGHDLERILVTLPAVREANIDAFTLRFVPVIDFQLDMVNVTEEQIKHLMLDPDPQDTPPPPRRGGRREPTDQEFGFASVNPFD